MTARPIRGDVFVACDWGDTEPQDMTLRQGLEWWKRANKIMRQMVEQHGVLTGMESKYIYERWAFLCKTIAEREGVPSGALSYFLGELATAELAAAEAVANVEPR